MSIQPTIGAAPAARPQAAAGAAARPTVLPQALLAAGLGLMLLWGAGFAHSDLLHAATHDARHAAGFPCH
ncbi:MAG TPA: CbtB domain-containing protein [Geminicoccaceae bacterium]|nr:CbtB domain-containing protein [Geminicoccaceae bacterium]